MSRPIEIITDEQAQFATAKQLARALADLLEGSHASREMALARTKAEEAGHWLDQGLRNRTLELTRAIGTGKA